jgi:two-component system, cell cycle sensor histidine kinase and response regulator CckA
MTESGDRAPRLDGQLEAARAQIAALERQVEVGQRDLAAAQRYRTLLDSVPLPIFEMRPDGQYTYVNSAYADALGKRPEDIVGKTLRDLFSEEHAARRAEILREVVLAGREASIDGEVLRPDGVHYYVALLRPLRDAAGNVTSVIGVSRDSTRDRLAEAALRESEGRLQRLLKNTDTGLVVIDAKGNVLLANEPYARMAGVTDPASLVGRSVIEWTAPDQRETNAAAVALCARQGFIKDFETIYQHADGTRLNIGIDAIIQNADGGVQLVSYCRDLTTRKRAAEMKAQLEIRLQQADKMESVGRLAGGVAHDFNNMLLVILGHADLALAQVEPAHPIHADLIELRAAAVRSAALTRQLLAFARKQTIAPRVLDLNAILTGMLRMLARLIGEDIRLEWKLGAGLWPVRVDPSQLDQILANLCVNARDAIADVGSVTIETGNSSFDEGYCARHPGAAPGDYVRLSVRDDGCGMDEATLARIFEPFFTTKTLGNGTGLGLATVYGIVRQNGGFILVDSHPGAGTTFAIHFPRRHEEPPARVHDTGPAPIASTRPATILLVEDERAVLRLTQRQLEALGYVVLGANSPGVALQLARDHGAEIDVLITDVVMPEMNGRVLSEHVLALCPRIQRVFVSGYPAEVIAHHGVLDEGVAFLQKPFSREALAEVVLAALRRA